MSVVVSSHAGKYTKINLPADTQRAAPRGRHRTIHPIALALAIAVHLAAAAVGLFGRFGAPKPDEVPITLDLVLAPPPAPDTGPTEAPGTQQASAPPQIPEQAAASPPPDAAPPDAAPPDAAPPDAVPPVPAAPKEVPQVVAPPPATPFRRPSRPVEAARQHAPASAPTHVAPAPHDEASAAPTPAALPPSSAPPRPPPPSSDPAWSSALSGWLQAHRTYPEAARRRGEQGQVGVRFTVLRDGQVQDVMVTRPSGYEALDTAAQTMLQSARVPPFPASMTQASMTVSVTIRFTLEK